MAARHRHSFLLKDGRRTGRGWNPVKLVVRPSRYPHFGSATVRGANLIRFRQAGQPRTLARELPVLGRIPANLQFIVQSNDACDVATTLRTQELVVRGGQFPIQRNDSARDIDSDVFHSLDIPSEQKIGDALGQFVIVRL